MRQAVNRRAAQLTKLCIKLNSDDFTVFCNFSGHTKEINVQVHLGGWDSNKEVSWSRTMYLTSEKALECLEDIIANLNKLKEGQEPPF